MCKWMIQKGIEGHTGLGAIPNKPQGLDLAGPSTTKSRCQMSIIKEKKVLISYNLTEKGLTEWGRRGQVYLWYFNHIVWYI